MGIRNAALGYGADSTRQKFTGYERDDETDLDFAQARYFSSTQGRFTSPDEFTGGPRELFIFTQMASSNPTFYADLTNPQSLNKYQYTYNNPLKFTDPDGHCPVCIVAAVAAVAAGASTVNAPGHKDHVYESEGAGHVIAGIFLGEAAGKFVLAPLFRYAGSKLFVGTAAESGAKIVQPTTMAVEELSTAATIGRSIGQEVFKMERGQMSAIAAKVTEKGLDQADAVAATQTAITTVHKSSNAVLQADGNVVLLSRFTGNNQPVMIIDKNGVVSTARATVNAGVDKVKGKEWFEIKDIVRD